MPDNDTNQENTPIWANKTIRVIMGLSAIGAALALAVPNIRDGALAVFGLWNSSNEITVEYCHKNFTGEELNKCLFKIGN